MWKNTKSKNPKVVRTKNGKIMLFSKYALCNSKKLTFFKEQEAKGLLSNLTGVKILFLSDLPILRNYFKTYIMNAIVDKLLLAGDKSMPQMHLNQPGFTFSACSSFTKNKERIRKI